MLCLLPKKTLIAGPYMGEFGWELMEWQGYIRKLRQRYERTIVISYPPSEYLYEECEFAPHGASLRDSGFAYGDTPIEAQLRIVEDVARERGVDHYDSLAPLKLHRWLKLLIGGQDFRRLREPAEPEDIFDVAFHFRAFVRADGDFKNYPLSDAQRVIDGCRAQGLRVACIGHPDLSIAPPPAEDRRSTDLRVAVRIISNARLMAGGSSAPMHLASLCATPMAVWTGPPFNADRYRTTWNPHRSPVTVVSEFTFRPSADAVISAVFAALDTAVPYKEIT